MNVSQANFILRLKEQQESGGSMSFWNKAIQVGKKVLVSVIDEGPKTQVRAQAQTVKTLEETEEILKQHENAQQHLSPEQLQKLELREPTYEERIQNLKEKGITVTANGEMRYGDYTYREWDRQWTTIGPLAKADLAPHNKSIGLYRHKLGNTIMYIGRATELHNGGFQKRLSDYRKSSHNARNNRSDKKIHSHIDRITTDILIVRNSDQDIGLCVELEKAFISSYQPEWNKKHVRR